MEIKNEQYQPLAISLMKVRTELLKKEVKKSGRNPMFKAPYFELKDFLPIITPLFYENGICTAFSIEIIDGVEYAILVLTKESERLVFKCPTANPSGSNPIFQMGQKITYFRRYLYQMALDLCESDEAELNEDNAKKVEYATPGQVATIQTKGKLIKEELIALDVKKINDIKELTKEKATELEKLIKERENAEVKVQG